jgi:hypothetical protein
MNLPMNDDEVSKGKYQAIYCGPTLPAQFGLREYTMFLGGLPQHVTLLVDKCPAINSLMVPVADLAQTRLALNKVGSVESVLYQEIQKSFKKGVK